MEEWKTIPSATDYEVSDHGGVRRRVDSIQKRKGRIYKKGYVLKPQSDKNGYIINSLCHNKIPKNYKRHRLVLETFVGPCPEEMNTNHIDGDKTNNHVSNLEWVSQSKNVQHAYKMGLFKAAKGEKAGSAKLKDGEVWLIKKLLASDLYKQKNHKLTQIKIAKMFYVAPSTIWGIASERYWSHIKYEETV